MPARSRAALLSLSLAVGLTVADATAINLALPALRVDLHASAAGLQWAVASFSLALAAALLPAGVVCDRIGAGRVMRIGLIGLAATSLLGAVAPSTPGLVLARVAQGIAAGAITASAPALIAGAFRGPAAGRAFQVYGAGIAAAAALGPLLGGVLIDGPGWRWVFVLNAPLAIAAAAGIRAGFPPAASSARDARSDAPGVALWAATSVLAVAAAIQGPAWGWWDSRPAVPSGLAWLPPGPVPAMLGAAVALAAGSIVRQRRRARRGLPTAAGGVIASRSRLRAGLAVGATAALGEFGLLFLLPAFLEEERGLSALAARTQLLPLAAGAAVATVAGRRLGTGRAVLSGLLVEGAALPLVALCARDAGWLLLASALLVYGAGLGLVLGRVSQWALEGVPFPLLGRASGAVASVRQAGAAAGVAVLGAVASTTTGAGDGLVLASLVAMGLVLAAGATAFLAAAGAAAAPAPAPGDGAWSRAPASGGPAAAGASAAAGDHAGRPPDRSRL